MTEADVLTRQEVLALLSKKAREGSVSAAIALERALRIGSTERIDLDNEFERLIRGDGEGE
jgi:hypothetical protein